MTKLAATKRPMGSAKETGSIEPDTNFQVASGRGVPARLSVPAGEGPGFAPGCQRRKHKNRKNECFSSFMRGVGCCKQVKLVQQSGTF